MTGTFAIGSAQSRRTFRGIKVSFGAKKHLCCGLLMGLPCASSLMRAIPPQNL